MIAFIDNHRGVFGVGPICRVPVYRVPDCRILGGGPSTFHALKAGERYRELTPDRVRQDRRDITAIRQAFDDSGVGMELAKIWHQLRRERRDFARCTVERLMKAMVLQSVMRGKKVITTSPDAVQPCPDDKGNSTFVADMPKQLRVGDFPCVSSWRGMVYVAFVIDIFARKIIGWRVSIPMTTTFVLMP